MPVLKSTSERMSPRPRRSVGWRGTKVTTKTLVVVAIVALIVPPTVVAIALSTLLFAPLPLPGSLPEERPAFVALPSTVYDRYGNELATFREFDLTVPTGPEDIPQVLKDAVIAAEDQRFWEHDGVDINGIFRAAQVNAEAGEIIQGGSTITQQYVKITYLDNDRTVERKLREALLATQLERRMSKEDILVNYLNSVYFGSGAYGAGAAAMSYFDKPVAELNLSEAATLAGLIPAPHRWSPRVGIEASEQRRKHVLRNMEELGMITKAEREAAAAKPLWNAAKGAAFGPATIVRRIIPKGAKDHEYFVDWIEATLLERYGAEKLYRGGLRIETTIDPDVQAMAEEAVNDKLSGTEAPLEMSLVSVEPSTGHVLAMVGGRDHTQSQVNLATGGTFGFQPGSSFKPIVLAEAFDQGIGPDTTYPAPGQWQVPGCGGGRGCSVANYSNSGFGTVSLRTATRLSINTVFAQLVLDVGVSDVVEMANDLGMSRLPEDKQYGVSLSLGAYEVAPLDMAQAYSVFANRGVRQDATGVLRVFDSEGRVMEDNRSRAGTRVLSTEVADSLSDVMRTVVESGTGKRAAIGRPVAGKTGTAQAYRAAWFVGYTPQLSTAVWMGHSDAQRSLTNIKGVGRVTGGSHPASTWSRFMRRYHEDLPVIDFEKPDLLPAGSGAKLENEDRNVSASDAPSEADEAPELARVGPAVRPGAQRQAILVEDGCGGSCVVDDGGVVPDLTQPVPVATTPVAPRPRSASSGTEDPRPDLDPAGVNPRPVPTTAPPTTPPTTTVSDETQSPQDSGDAADN